MARLARLDLDGARERRAGDGARRPRAPWRSGAASTPRRRRASARPSARSWSPRSRAPRASSPTRASSPRRREAVVAGRARQARAAARRAGGAVNVRAGRALPARPGALRHALRPGPHAPAHDRARLAAGALPARSTSSGRTASRRRRAWPARSCERHGLRTGTYLSPHLVSFTERIRIAERDVEPERFAAAVARAARAAEKVNRTLEADDRVTQFEALTAAAYSEMAEAGVEVAVIEAGLGGRYDATNVIPSEVAGAHQRRAGAHALAGADDRATSPRRSWRSCGEGSTLVIGPDLDPDALALARSAPRRSARRRAGDGDRPGRARRLPAAQLRAGARGGGGAGRRARRRRGARRGGGDARPGAVRGRRPAIRRRSSTARTTPRA